MQVRKLVNPLEVDDTDYFSDSETPPIAETEIHVDAMIHLKQSMTRWLDGTNQTRSWVGYGQLWFWDRDKLYDVLLTDIMVVLDVERVRRDKFRSWAEGCKVPSLMIEVVTKDTVSYDSHEKQSWCSRLGVPEFWLFDPSSKVMEPPFVAGTLVDGKYREIPADADGFVTSNVLGFRARAEGAILRLSDPETGEPIPSDSEVAVIEHRRLVKAEAQNELLREKLRQHSIDPDAL